MFVFWKYVWQLTLFLSHIVHYLLFSLYISPYLLVTYFISVHKLIFLHAISTFQQNMTKLLACLFLLCHVCSFALAEDFYEMLGVPRNADEREIRKGFKKKALTLHPDKNTVSFNVRCYATMFCAWGYLCPVLVKWVNVSDQPTMVWEIKYFLLMIISLFFPNLLETSVIGNF